MKGFALRIMNISLSPIFFIFLFFFAVSCLSAPYDGEEFELKQPDGSYVKVIVYGDEYYTRVESLDGYTLIKDSKTNWICYAKLSKNGELISTGIPYKGIKKSKPPKNLKKHLKESSDVMKKKREKARKEIGSK